MFSKDITTSDAFREMPTSSQALYFHLGMEADDDGFLDNYKGLMRAVNATDDDLRILIAKRFLILFPSKVVVVKHWLINNTIRKDRYSETKHLDEKRALLVKENGSYTELSNGLPSGNQVATQYRIEEDRIVSATREEKPLKKYPNAPIVFKWFSHPEPSWQIDTTQCKHAELLFLRGEETVKQALAFHAKHADLEDRPMITKPSHLETKWNELIEFANRNGL